jgi:hypothetical protein
MQDQAARELKAVRPKEFKVSHGKFQEDNFRNREDLERLGR